MSPIDVRGFASSLTLAIWLSLLPGFGFLRRWGELSLQMYAAHTIASAGFRIFLLKVLKIDDPILHLVTVPAARGAEHVPTEA